MILYDDLQNAYTFFNEKLFSKSLPECIITLQRNAHTRGYFASERFVSSEDEKVFSHEIALNPAYFAVSEISTVLSTLVHEMVHLVCFLKKIEGKNGYHNNKWAVEMEKVGLIPSCTGKEGGEKTGYAMSHYIDPNGAFEKECAFLCREGFHFSWHDKFVSGYLSKSSIIALNIPVENLQEIEFSEKNGTRHFSGVISSSGGLKTEGKESKNGRRIKYSCKCSSVWGKSDLELFCKKCNEAFEVCLTI